MLKRRQVRMLIAESLLTEAVNPKIRKQLSRLMSFNHLGVVIKKGNTNVIFEYGLISPEGYHEVIPKRRKTSAPLTTWDDQIYNVLPRGFVKIQKPVVERAFRWGSEHGPCLDGYIVSLTDVTTGWGPLLYEVALEWASVNSAGLTPDRFSVTDKAAKVWKVYGDRPEVDKQQLDVAHGLRSALHGNLGDIMPQLTPDNEADDCHQHKEITVAGEQWMVTPFSKMFRKSTAEITDYLRMMGRIIES